MAKTEVVMGDASERATLGRLMQLYAYDFSEFMAWDVDGDALFDLGDALAKCWSAPSRRTYFIRVDERIAGFAITDACSRLTDATEVMDVAEFFVMRKYRRQRVGATAARQLFTLHPGQWEVRQMVKNVAATAFWRRAIAEHTGGAFAETLWDDARWRGPVQTFGA
jgi:predicted acetyltransferase